MIQNLQFCKNTTAFTILNYAVIMITTDIGFKFACPENRPFHVFLASLKLYISLNDFLYHLIESSWLRFLVTNNLLLFRGDVSNQTLRLTEVPGHSPVQQTSL